MYTNTITSTNNVMVLNIYMTICIECNSCIITILLYVDIYIILAVLNQLNVVHNNLSFLLNLLSVSPWSSRI